MIHLCLTMIGIVLLFYLAALYMSAALGILALLLAGIVLLSLAVIVWRMCSIRVALSIPFLLAQSGRCLSDDAGRPDAAWNMCAVCVCGGKATPREEACTDMDTHSCAGRRADDDPPRSHAVPCGRLYLPRAEGACL